MQQRSLARQFNTALFEDLAASGLDLENIVYFRSPDVHYFVCTPRRCVAALGTRLHASRSRVACTPRTCSASLIAYGALLAARPPATLLRRDNVDSEAVASYARRVATRFGLPEAVPMMPGWSGAALFDFSARSQATEALRVVEHPASAHAGGGAGTAPVDHPPLLVGLSGDSLMEPFWPEGLGINRGFLGALDTRFVCRNAALPCDACGGAQTWCRVLLQLGVAPLAFHAARRRTRRARCRPGGDAERVGCPPLPVEGGRRAQVHCRSAQPIPRHARRNVARRPFVGLSTSLLVAVVLAAG